MNKTELLEMALEKLTAASNYIDTLGGVSKGYRMDIERLKAALEAEDEKANDELRRLHDLLGKANALARIRANKIDELEQRLTKTEAPAQPKHWEKFCDSNCVWTDHHPDCKLAHPEQEPVAWVCHGTHGHHDIDFLEEDVDSLSIGTQLYTTPPQRKPEQEQRNVTEQEHDVLMNSIKASSTVVSKGFLAQPEQEPVATDWDAVHEKIKLVWYRELSADEGLDEIQDLINTTPYVATPRPQRKPLTDEEIHKIYEQVARQEPYGGIWTRKNVVRAIEAAHGITGESK